MSKNEKIHECFYKKGKIMDVMYNDREIKCRMCGKVLIDDHVEPKTLAFIKMKKQRNGR